MINYTLHKVLHISLYYNNFTLNLQKNVETIKTVYFKYLFNDIFLLKASINDSDTDVSIKWIFSPKF